MGRTPVLVLVAVASFLLMSAGLTRFWVADKVLVSPADQYQESELEAKDAQYFSVAEGKVVTADLRMIITTRGDVAQATDSRVVWDEFTVVDDVTHKRQIDISERRSAFDRRTGVGVSCCGTRVNEEPVELEGQIYLYPIGVEKKTYKFYNQTAKGAYEATFVGEDTVDGLPVYKFQLKVPPTKIDTVNLPGSFVGLDEKGEVKLDRWYESVDTHYVEPMTGGVVKQDISRNETFKTQDGVERSKALVADVTFTPETVEELVGKATAAKNQITLLKVTIPVVLLVLGLLAIAAALVVSRLRPREA
ncbi:DUF3068 domain-containing protein [Nonomuraea mesophila]|uniref:DUF3068 domain-containing protein n=1 Tax=Nonomuraea mesophila TaxID=2530382 RepID=A0A4R5F7U2_9ACTN|nr:DUF3068 domain-containing protein [Nonomuraea mesophila]TDE43688.1 DUF3068 domain-containing protein [Nonomuraea mesophila]